MTKLYALAHAHQVGLFHDWGAAQPLVNGYPGARYKSFPDPTDAYHFVYGQPWPGDGDPLVVCHSDGWAALVDPTADVAAQIADGAPRPGTPVPQPETDVRPDTVTVAYDGQTVERPVDRWLAIELDRLGLLP